MSDRFIDSSIFLRHLTTDDPQRSELSTRLLEQVEKGEQTAVINAVVLFEVIFTLHRTYGISRPRIREWMLELLAVPHLKIPERKLFAEALDVFAAHNIPFGDAYIVASMREHQIQEIYSWDAHFDRVPGITRIAPE